eukprot:381243-Amorphochlora_amoeboformis.AAC.1
MDPDKRIQCPESPSNPNLFPSLCAEGGQSVGKDGHLCPQNFGIYGIPGIRSEWFTVRHNIRGRPVKLLEVKNTCRCSHAR